MIEATLRLARNTQGNVAMIAALAAFTLVVVVGAAIDFHRQASARELSQQAVDAAALAAATTNYKTQPELKRIADNYLDGNLDGHYLEDGADTTLDYRNEIEIEVGFAGDVKPIFLGLIGIRSLPVNVSATAVRGQAEQVELALVLDNTWSMSDVDARGVKKIDALKSASRTLVDRVMQREEANVRVGIVPYADYVNVGVANRGQPWLSVPADYSSTYTPPARTCTGTSNQKEVCTGSVSVPRTCTRTVDGVSETYSCPYTDNTNRVCHMQTVPTYETGCSGGGSPSTTWYRWYGCVKSRKTGNLRLNDTRPDVPYEGIMDTSQKCLNPIVPLSNVRTTVQAAIQGLIVNIGTGYRPYTYIPAGLVWGVNLLSPSAPFIEGGAYDTRNRDPRKILVLMTDGENTLQFRASDGLHVAFSAGAAGTNQLKKTNDDVEAICAYAKSKNIEIFTVALAVNSTSAQDMLENCATDSEHYFDAKDTAALESSFAAIGASINRVRLTR